MQNYKTTTVGTLLAASMAVKELSGIPTWLHALSTVLVPTLTACFGYLCADNSSTAVPIKAVAMVFFAVGLATLVAGCSLQGLRIGATNTPVGSFAVGADGVNIFRKASNDVRRLPLWPVSAIRGIYPPVGSNSVLQVNVGTN